MSEKSPLDQLQFLLADDLKAVNDLLATRMASENAPRIPEVTAHLIGAGGKRLRPMLTLAAARMFNYLGTDHHKLAATVEFIHTATLLHDDVVDESARRRGHPTANLLWGNKSSVLVGDYLFSRSFQLMVECGSLRILDILANASATIAEGEVLQMTAAQNLATDQVTYLRVVRGKTAALFAAACEVGAVVANAPEPHVIAMRNFGDALGIAFQIADDVLDYTGQTSAIGKNTGDDFREGKLTLPVILALAKADKTERGFWQRALENLDQSPDDFAQALAIMTQHGTLEATRQIALDWSAKARAALAGLPETPLKTAFIDLSDYVVARLT